MFRLILILVIVTDIMTGCSTVLLPAKVVQALNLNLEGMGAQAQFQPRFNASFTTDSGKCLNILLVITGGSFFIPDQID